MKLSNTISFRMFMLSDFFVQFGAGISLTAVSWYILDVTQVNSNVSLFFNVNILSGFLGTLLSMKLISRISKKELIIGINLFRAVTVLSCLFLLKIDQFRMIYILIIALGNGVGWNMYLPVSKSIIPEIANKEEIMKANSISETIMQIGLFSAGAISGMLYKYIGFPVILVINIICFGISILCMTQITIKREKKLKSSNLTKESESIMKFFKTNKTIFIIGLVMYIPFAAATCINVSLPGYVSNILQRDSVVFGILDMLYGVGACLAGFIIIRVIKRMEEKTWVILSYVVAIVCGLVLVISHNTYITGLVMLFLGICGPGIRIILNTYIMKEVSDAFLGKAMVVWNFLGLIMQIILSTGIGMAMDYVGAEYGFSFYSIIMVVGCLLFCLKYRNKI